MDFAIGLSLVNGISGQISQIVGDFKRLDGVTDEVMKQLSQFKNISITGGLLAGAGIKGLQATLDVLDICVDKAAELQSTSLNLEIKAFGTDLLEQTNLPQIKAEMEELENKAMDISLNTVFNQNEIEQSMISMVKGGMSREMIEGYGAEANANFAQINGVKATSTADATVKFAAGFQLEENQIKDSLDLITKYADASISDALAIQQNIGNTTGSAMSVWKNRDNMQIAEETIQLVAATRYTAQDEASAATYVRNFLDQAGKTTFTDPQVAMMEKAGWLLEDGKSIFIDYHTGMLKSAAELEKILEDTAESMDAVDFNNLVDAFFGDRGKKTAQALAQKGGATDLAVLKLGANKQLGIDEQVARQMETAAAQMGILNEAIDTLKATVGKPFLEPIAKMLKVINPQLAVFAKYLKQHPEVVKFMTAIAAGASAFLVLAGGIMLAIGLVGSFKLIWAKAGAQIVAHFAPILSTFGVVTAVIAGIAGLAFVVYRHWGTFQPKFASIWENIKQILASAKQSFLNFANNVKPIISGILEVLEVVAFAVALVVLPVINAALMVLAGILNGNVVQAFQNAWNSMGIFSQILFLGVSALLIYKGVMLAVSIATKIWTIVQGVLNIVLAANPVGLVVLAIASLIAAVIVIIMYFKEFTEWVQKGWDKLKNFLGFKREHKDELEAPIDIGIEQTEQVNKITSISTITDTSTMTDMGQYGVNRNEIINPEIIVKPSYQLDSSSTEVVQQALESTGIQNIDGTELNPEVLINPSYQTDIDSIKEMEEQLKGIGENTFDFTNMNYTMPDMTGDLQEVTNIMQTGGMDAGNAFADALSGTGGNVQSAIQSINSIIESTLLNKEQMYLWGSNLIQSFINGMNSQKVNLMTTAAALAVTIGDYLKVQSPSRKGELKTNHLWGGNLIKSFAEGMKKEQGLLKSTTAILAEQTGGLQNSIRMENWHSEGIGRYHRKNEKKEEKETEQRPIYIVIQGAEKRENEIAQEVARELDKRGYGKKKREKSPSLTMSPYKILGGY